MLLLALLPVIPANAETSVISIATSEQITRHYTYQPTATYTDGAVTLDAATATGSGTVTLTNTAGIALNNVVILFNAGSTSGWAQAAGDSVSATVSGSGPVTVTINNFPASGVVHLTYQVASTVAPAITLSATYTKNSIVNSATDSTTIELTATNTGSVAVTPTFVITPADSATLGTHGTPDWSLSSTSSGVTAGTGGALNWASGAIAAGASSTVNILATVNDVDALNDSVSNVALYDVATSAVTYSASESVSGVSVTSVTAGSSEVTTSINKRLSGGNWEFISEVSVPSTSAIAYDLTQVSVWAVDSSNINTPISGATKTIDSGNHDPADGTWPVVLTGTGTNTWTAQGTEILSFAYSGVPVGFVKPSISIKDTDTQYPVTSTSASNGVDLLKKIYVINGYQVEVVKTVTPTSNANEYQIHIVATNIGTAATPTDVYVYDIVTAAFYSTTGTISPHTMTPSAAGQTAVTGGEAYYWNLGSLASGASSTIDYYVIGAGTYSISDLYVVGIDPAQSLNLQTTPVLSNMSTMVNANFETLAALGAAGLLVIGMIGTARRRD